MKTIKFLSVLFFFAIMSCSPVKVASDFDKKTDFSQFKTYAFYKTGIDKVEISDLDKKRILRSIDESMTAKGFTKSEDPDLLINFFTKAHKEVYVDQYYGGWGYGYGYGWGWGYPYYWGGYPWVYTSTEGTLYIDLIDNKKKEMVWQGEGVGTLTQNSGDKDERIKEFVSKILKQYPPEKK
jgi:hypothetical protein